MENSTRVPATIMVDVRAGEETLQGIEEQLMQIQKSGFHVPMIFLCVAGSSNPQAVQSVQVPEVIAERWIRVVRLMLELQQPIYGMATGTMSPFGIMLLEACDCVLADTVQEGVHANRILKPLEMALVCKVAAEEAESMNDAQLVEHKAKFVRDKLYARFPKLSKSAKKAGDFDMLPAYIMTDINYPSCARWNRLINIYSLGWRSGCVLTF